MTSTGLDYITNTMWHAIAYNNQIMIVNQDISTGAPIGSRYIANSLSGICGTVYGAAFQYDIFYFSFVCDIYYIIVTFNTLSGKSLSKST